MNSVELMRPSRYLRTPRRVADLGDVLRAGLDLLGVGLPRQDAEVEGIQRGARVRRGRQDLAEHGPRPGLGPVWIERAVHEEEGLGNRPQDLVVGDRRIDAEEGVEEDPGAVTRTALAWPFAAPGAPPSPAASAAFLPFWLALAACTPCRAPFVAPVGTNRRSAGRPSACTRASTIWSDRSRLGQFEANAVLPAGLAVDRTRRW